MDAKDCGPACIKMIAKYYGKYYSLQYLRDLCGITREGVSFLDISYAAEKIGLRTVAVKATMENLTNRIPLPCIIHWDQHHFIVVYKTKKGKIYVSDPAKGLLSYPEEDFKDRWYKEGEEFGMLMVLEPMANFKQIEAHERIERFKSFENLLNYFTPYKKAFGILFAIMLIATGLQAVLPFISKSVIDIGIYTQDISFIYMMLIGNIVLLLSITLSNVLRDWVLLHVSTRVNISLISDYLIKLMKLPVTFFENKLVGDILQRAGDHERIRSFVMNNSLGMFFSIITFVVFSIILLIYNPMIFFIFGILALLAAFCLFRSEYKAAAVIPGALAAVLIVISCVSFVPTGYTGIVTTFGKVENGTKDAGVVVKAPWQSIVKMDNRVQEVSIDLSAFSSDIQEVATSVTVGYRINQANAMTIYKEVGRKYEDVLILPRVPEVVKAVVAHYDASSLISNRDAVAEQMDAQLRSVLAQYNIDLSYISITNFDFTDTFTDAVEAKVKAQQEKEKAETDAEKRRVEAQATADADLIAAKAEAEKSKVAADAELYAAQKKAEANDALTDSLDSNLLEYYRITGVDALWDGKLPTYVGGESSVPVLNGLS